MSDAPPPGALHAPTPPPSPRTDGQGFDLGDFLSFRYLITPGLVTAIYVIGAVLITLFALSSVAFAPNGAGGLVAALAIFVFGNLYWRVILEFIMVLFRINDSLAAIERRGRGM